MPLQPAVKPNIPRPRVTREVGKACDWDFSEPTQRRRGVVSGFRRRRRVLVRDRQIHDLAARGRSQRSIAGKIGKSRSCVQYVLRRDERVVAAHGRILLLRRRVAPFFRRSRRVDCEPTSGSKGAMISGRASASRLPLETLSREDGVALVAWYASAAVPAGARDQDDWEFDRSLDRRMAGHPKPQPKQWRWQPHPQPKPWGRYVADRAGSCEGCGWALPRAVEVDYCPSCGLTTPQRERRLMRRWQEAAARGLCAPLYGAGWGYDGEEFGSWRPWPGDRGIDDLRDIMTEAEAAAAAAAW